MSEGDGQALPRGWAWTQLGDLGVWSGGGTPSTTEPAFWTNGNIPWVSPKDMKSFEIYDAEDHITSAAIEGSATSQVRAGAVLVVTRSGILRRTLPVAVARRAVALNQDLKALSPYGGLDSRFIAYALRSSEQRILHECVKDGTTVQSIETPALKSFMVPLAPTAEQERICDALDELLSDVDEGVMLLVQARAKLKAYRASVLKAAVDGTLTAEWREGHPDAEPASDLLDRILVERRRRWEEEQLTKFEAKGQRPPSNWRTKYREPEAPRDVQLAALPQRWSWGSVEQLGEVQLGRQRAPQHHDGDHMRPYLRVANVYEDRLDLTDVKRMNFTPDEFETYALRRGDILLNEGQSPELVGRSAMYRDEIPGCCYQKTLLRFRSHPGVSAAYALVVFRAYLHNGRFRRSASITTSIAHLAAERFVRIEMPLPPLAEQDAIVEIVEDQLSVVDHLEADLDAKLKAAQSLRQSLLRHAFTGQLVPQDPNDEPASALLARIAAVREVRHAASRGSSAPRRQGRGRPTARAAV